MDYGCLYCKVEQGGQGAGMVGVAAKERGSRIPGRAGTAHQGREWAIVRCTRFANAPMQLAELAGFQERLG